MHENRISCTVTDYSFARVVYYPKEIDSWVPIMHNGTTKVRTGTKTLRSPNHIMFKTSVWIPIIPMTLQIAKAMHNSISNAFSQCESLPDSRILLLVYLTLIIIESVDSLNQTIGSVNISPVNVSIVIKTNIQELNADFTVSKYIVVSRWIHQFNQHRCWINQLLIFVWMCFER